MAPSAVGRRQAGRCWPEAVGCARCLLTLARKGAPDHKVQSGTGASVPTFGASGKELNCRGRTSWRGGSLRAETSTSRAISVRVTKRLAGRRFDGCSAHMVIVYRYGPDVGAVRAGCAPGFVLGAVPSRAVE